MDPGVAVRIEEMRAEGTQQTHEGDSALYVRLAMAAFDLNERLRMYRREQADAVWRVIGMALINLQLHLDAQRITEEQRDRLKYILSDGIEEPTATNNVPVFRIPFPATQPIASRIQK